MLIIEVGYSRVPPLVRFEGEKEEIHQKKAVNYVVAEKQTQTAIYYDT